MKINLKSSLIVTISGLAALLIVGVLALNLAGSPAAASTAAATVADLTTAGYTQVKALAPQGGGRYSGPNLYFTVGDKVSSPSSEAPDVVAVSDLSLPYVPGNGALFQYGNDSHDFNISGGLAKEATMADGRTAINFLKAAHAGSHYVVLIGPNQNKLEKLAADLAAKIQ